MTDLRPLPRQTRLGRSYWLPAGVTAAEAARERLRREHILRQRTEGWTPPAGYAAAEFGSARDARNRLRLAA